ncbi:MAG: S-layer homology domain-containing protein [Clostridia bacterium]|nr:S-layer homology domain-containing protein [Clostridia bacterium]
MKKMLACFLAFVLSCSAIPVFGASEAAKQTFSTESVKDEIIIPVTEKTGTWSESDAIKNYDGGKHIWSNQKGDTLTFKVENVKEGTYEVYYWVCPHKFNSKEMQFVVTHNGKESEAKVYQKIEESETVSPGWVSMGVFDFSGENDEKLVHTNPGGNTRGSAVKLVPTDKAATAEPAEKPSQSENAEAGALGDQIDVEPSGVCTWEGKWSYSTATPGPMTNYPDHLWAAGQGEEAFVTYNPMIGAVGDVRISIYQLYWHENQTNDIKYEIHHNGKVDEIHLNPLDIDKNQWITLGTYDFKGNPEEEFLKLVCVKNENEKANTRASTVLFEILNERGGTAWQALYVTPHRDAEMELQMAMQSVKKLEKFDDMVGHWAHYDVEYMANEGLVSGVSDNAFDPEAQITRAEYVTILDRALGFAPVNGESFADVAQDAWYATYVATAKANGLLKGLPTHDGFKPEQPITRQEMALFTYNAIRATKKNDEWVAKLPSDWNNFLDTAEVSEWAKEALQYLVQTGIIKGTSETTVSALENATRAQGAVILKRFMQSFVWAGPPTDEEWVMTFNEEFDGDSVDWSVWKSANGPEGHILSSRWPENAVVKDGAVHLEVRKEVRGGQSWTAGSISVRPEVFSQAYGYWEARYKFTESTGVNNSFWMSGGGVEIDVCEGHYPNKANTNYHVWEGEHTANSKQEKSEYDLSADYHTYGLEWNETELLYYLDGRLIATKAHDLAHTPLYPKLSSAVLSWAGAVSDKTDGTAQIVDYVRIWQRPADVNDPSKTVIGKPVEGAGPADNGPVAPGIETNSVTVESQEIDTNTYEGEIIVTAKTEGNWKESSFLPAHDGGKHLWSDKKGATATYDLSALSKGKYKVYMWRLPHEFNVAQMDMLLHQDGKDELAGSMALKIPSGTTAEPGWVLLGEHEIKGGEDCYIHYTCTGVNCRASAIKLVPVK